MARIVLAHGVFDVLHIGHIRLLKTARNLGGEVYVSLLSDRFVTMYKGPSRPIHMLSQRMEQILELRCVDRVVVVDGPGHEAVQRMIEDVKPSVYVKGLDTKGKFAEEEWVKAMGIEMMFVKMWTVGDGKPISSTELLRRTPCALPS